MRAPHLDRVASTDGVGGRVRSDHVDGFTLDRGFQVVFTSYPELAHRFDRDGLDLRAFQRGADVWAGGRRATGRRGDRGPGRGPVARWAHSRLASIQGARHSGRRTAAAILAAGH